MLRIMTPQPVRAAAHRCRTPTGTATARLSTGLRCASSHAPWRSPKTCDNRCLCGVCATVTGAVFPDGVTAPVQYGPRITAWVRYLLYAQSVPEKRLAELMSDLIAVSSAPRSPPWAGPPGASSPSSPMSQT